VTSATATPASPHGKPATTDQAAARGPAWRARAGLAAAVAAIAAVVAVPAPHRAPARSLPAGPTGPPALASRWPSARPFPIPSMLPGGFAYRPEVVLDRSTTAGIATSADQQRVSLVIARASGPPRILQTDTAGLASFDGITAYGGKLFWMHSNTDPDAAQHTSLWVADQAGGLPRRLTADTGTPDLAGTRYALQLAAGRLYWIGSDQDGATTRLRSIAVTGGAVMTRVIPGRWQLSAWPWLSTVPAPDVPAELLNLTTGTRIRVHAPAQRIAVCSPDWCRISAGNASQPQETTLMHPDGSHSQRIATGGTTAITDEVALRGRFEPLAGAINSNGISTATPLSLYDLRTASTVLVDPAATDARASGDYLWWSSGDNETQAWQGLDLRTLS
jgi:hypothetical protein